MTHLPPSGKKRSRALALRYDAKKDRAPRVTAKGEGLIAEQIVALAREAGIPVRPDPDLIEILSGLEVNSEIPPETYVVVAEVLAWVYRMNNRVGKEGPAR